MIKRLKAVSDLKVVLALAAAIGAAWGVSHLKVDVVKQLCSAATRWHASFKTGEDPGIISTNGVFTVFTYSIANGFGIRKPVPKVISVRAGKFN